MKPDLAYLLGVYLGDGCICSHVKGTIFSLVSIDEDLCERIHRILALRFNSVVKVSKIQNDRYFSIRSTKQALISFILVHCGWNKQWPDCWAWSEDCKKELLIGLLDTDGFSCYQKDKMIKGKLYDQVTVGFSSTSDWISEVRRLAQSLGIRVGKLCVQSNEKKNGHKGEKVVYKINLNVRDLITYRLGFHVERKQKRLDTYANKYDLPYPHRLYARH